MIWRLLRRQLAPAIAVVKAALVAQPGCLLARMSGSGATCFGLFASLEQATAAQHRRCVGWPPQRGESPPQHFSVDAFDHIGGEV